MNLAVFAPTLRNWIKARRWWVAFVLVAIAGYSLGKDAALRDNARDGKVVNERLLG